jgi:glycine/D-amino acid oxidase-like deaminating enzyme
MSPAAQETFAPDFKESPYWWEEAPRPAGELPSLPHSVDVAIVGSGVTGLNAAIPLVRAGRSVLVIEAGAAGEGASTLNAGFLGRTLKHSFGELVNSLGLARAVAFYRELTVALDHVEAVVKSEELDCSFRRCGRFIGAPSLAGYDAMAREYALRERHLGEPFAMIERAAQSQEIGTDSFHGGALIPDLATIDPARYQLELLRVALAAGAVIACKTAVVGVRRDAGSYTLRTGRGEIVARDVLVATNGYTGAPFGWFRRRLVPFHGYMIATEKLAPEVVTRALPSDRTYHDYRHNIQFLRRSPDGTRVLFGARTGGPAWSLRTKAERLRRMLAALLPDLASARVSHAWTGRCAATFDLYPHVGSHDGVHYALGYCFAGMPMGSYLGHKAALRILGDPDGRTVFDERDFPTRPFYSGHPWFLPLVMAYYDWQDRRA